MPIRLSNDDLPDQDKPPVHCVVNAMFYVVLDFRKSQLHSRGREFGIDLHQTGEMGQAGSL